MVAERWDDPENLEVSFLFNGVEIKASDFDPKSVTDWVAYSIAYAANTHCRDKEAALEHLRGCAAELVRTVIDAYKRRAAEGKAR